MVSADQREILETDPFDQERPGAVLLSDEILRYCNDPGIPENLRLLSPFEEAYLGAARYNLRLGTLTHLGGRRIELAEGTPLVLPPHQVAVVQTLEEIRLPRFLIARWNLRVSMVYEGLLWTGALQVDPGYRGHLFCPLYNLAERTVTLKYGQELFAMDFVRTTPFKAGRSKPYPQVRGSLEEFDRNRLQSAPFEVTQEMSDLRKRVQVGISRVDDVADRVNRIVTALMTAIGVIVASLTLLIAGRIFQEMQVVGPSDIAWTSAILALIAAVMSMTALAWVIYDRGRGQD